MADELAIHGGPPVRRTILPYGRQVIDEGDIAAVVETLRSDWLTTGPKVDAFETEFAKVTGADFAIAVNSGTAALHAAMAALGVGPGDEVIVPTYTFAASANCALFVDATPVFVDVVPDTLLIDLDQVESKITARTKAIVPVDFAGHPCDYDRLGTIGREHGIAIVADACHSVGGAFRGRPVGALADLSCFSFHPVKHIAAGEGGMVTTDDPDLAAHLRRFRSHGIDSDHRKRAEEGTWFYEMTELGVNYRLSDIQCALGLSQLGKLGRSVARRQAIAARYDAAFSQLGGIRLLSRDPRVSHAHHLYVIGFDPGRFSVGRKEIFAALRAEGIGVNVHYIPVHMHPYYRERFGTGAGDFPVAERAYETSISLPMFAGMSDADTDDVVAAIRKVWSAYRLGDG